MSILSRIAGFFLLLCCFFSLCAADSVTGKVQNLTTGHPAAGDEVVLLRLAEGMEAEASTRTDADGAFTLPLATPSAQYVVRVIHQGVNYDQNLSGSAQLEVSVFDAAAKVPGLRGNLGIVKVESADEMLKITEMYSISNASSPQVTQTGPRNFEFSLAQEAKLDSFQARKAGGVWLNLTPTPVKGKQGTWAVNFPLRHGETLFKFTYRLPYDGLATLHVKLAYPIENFAVVHPPALNFRALRTNSFTSPGLVQGMKLEQAVAKPVVREVPAFEISGVGVASATQAESAPEAPPSFPASTNSNPAKSSPASVSVANPSQSQMWLVIAGISAVLFAGVAGWWRSKKSIVALGMKAESVIASLKQALDQLEVEKKRGEISAEQYDSTRQALDMSLRRAVARSKS
ncbi:MAG TPA: carboxypeptidase-like regulatory domain-containing protein [Candidatus Angelobacter sp.]|nr:carboxypeptidase-like regulatory domain-containing protein [Candidatus Angelobacter sp.]